MSFINDLKSLDYTEFTGANLLVDEEDVTEPQALYNRNTEFIEGQVRTRRGFKNVWNPAVVITTMYNWIQSNFNRLLYLIITTGVVISRDLNTAVESAITTVGSAAGMTFAEEGYRIYMGFFDVSGFGLQQPLVWDGTFSGPTANVDPVFQPPLDTTQLFGGTSWGTFSEPGTGSVTAGQHLFNLVGVTWNGFQQPPGPTFGGAFTVRAFTASGGKNLQIIVTPATTWPTWLYSLQIAMTTVNNPDRWFLVPSSNGGGPIPVGPRGSGAPITFTIDIDDVTLTGGGPTEITNTLFNLFTGICLAHCILQYNNRMIYVFRQNVPSSSNLIATIFASDPGAPQYVIPALNSLTLPENRDMITAAQLGATLYVFGPSWIYAFTDNGNTPANWPPPIQVSGNIGSPFIRGVTVNPGRGRMWVCDHTGLYAFIGGVMSEVPASYWQTPDWDRINFTAPAQTLVVKEYPESRLVVVQAPLDGATVANHLLVWDFTDGFQAGSIKYCGLWDISDFPGIGDIEVVINPNTGNARELWISRGDANGPVRRLKTIESGDATTANPIALYDDNGNGINSIYKLLAISMAAQGPQMQVGARLRVRGVGPINVTAYSFDQQRTTPMEPISAIDLPSGLNSNGYVMGLQPGQRFDRFLDEQSEAISYQIDNGGAPGVFFYWAAARFYYLPWTAQRD